MPKRDGNSRRCLALARLLLETKGHQYGARGGLPPIGTRFEDQQIKVVFDTISQQLFVWFSDSDRPTEDRVDLIVAGEVLLIWNSGGRYVGERFDPVGLTRACDYMKRLLTLELMSLATGEEQEAQEEQK